MMNAFIKQKLHEHITSKLTTFFTLENFNFGIEPTTYKLIELVKIENQFWFLSHGKEPSGISVVISKNHMEPKLVFIDNGG